MFELEYNALREEKLNRYDYANKLTTDLITFSTAVGGACLAMYAIYNKENDLGGNTTILILKYMQSLLMLAPALFATVTHKHSILNSIRINLISDYLREMSSARITWEKFKTDCDVQYFDFPYDRSRKRIGDITGLCYGTTVVSLGFSYIMALIVSLNLIGESELWTPYIIASIGCPLFIYLIKLSWDNKPDAESIMREKAKQYICILIAIIPCLIMGFHLSNCKCIVKKLEEGWCLPFVFISCYSIATIHISPYNKMKDAAEKYVQLNATKLKRYVENKMMWG